MTLKLVLSSLLLYSSTIFAEIKTTDCASLIVTLLKSDQKLIQKSKTNDVVKIGIKSGVSEAQAKSWKSYTDVINDVYLAVAKKYDETNPKAADEFAEHAKDLREFYKNLNEDSVAELDFLVARNVLDLERITKKEFQKVDSFVLSKNTDEVHVDYTQYMEYVKSYVRGTSPYEDITQSAGLISREQIRDIQSYNLWPIYMTPHDIKHVHFGISHPKAMATVLKSARSKNHLRYIMISALFEGIETVQYPEETALCRYMAEEMGMKLEEAMVYLGRVSNKELEEIADKTGYKSKFESVANDFANWKPKIAGNYKGKGQTGKPLEQEIDLMLELLQSYEKKSDIDDVMTYAVDPGSESNPDPHVINY